MNFSEKSFWLGSRGRRLAATCFAPERARGAVLFIGPFAEERKGALPVVVALARRLARGGVASLWFDFSGCGDSEGDFADTPPEAFEEDCASAYAWLAETYPPPLPHIVLGIRTGGGLALRLAPM